MNVGRKNWMAILDPLEILMNVIGVAQSETVTMSEAWSVTGVLWFKQFTMKYTYVSVLLYTIRSHNIASVMFVLNY